MTSVGFVGAGAMGAPMIERLIEAGHDTSVYARRTDVLDPFIQRGARGCTSIAEVAASASVMIVCVFSDEQVVDVCLGGSGVLAAMSPGGVVVIHTTGSPKLARRLHAEARTRDVSVVDAPVSGGPGDIRSGQITVLLGGTEAAVASCKAVLSAYADPIIHMGDVGAAQSVKLVNNALLAANLALALEGARVGSDLGIDPSVLVSGISNCSGASRALDMMDAASPAAQLLDTIRPFLKKDLTTVRAVAHELGLDLGILGRLGWEVFGD